MYWKDQVLPKQNVTEYRNTAWSTIYRFVALYRNATVLLNPMYCSSLIH